MTKYILRLDDACPFRDLNKWDRMEKLLDKYHIKPLVGIIPHCEDPELLKYNEDASFWNTAESWVSKGWTIALHGYNHVYTTNSGGLNPINSRSEFAGESLQIQKEKIRNGVKILQDHNIEPLVFFAPSHTFDENTLISLKEESNIRIISDTIAFDSYKSKSFTFVPQQSGKARKLPFKTVTFCYHPNQMTDNEFCQLEKFIERNEFSSFPTTLCKRRKNIFDKVLTLLYFARR